MAKGNMQNHRKTFYTQELRKAINGCVENMFQANGSTG